MCLIATQTSDSRNAMATVLVMPGVLYINATTSRDRELKIRSYSRLRIDLIAAASYSNFWVPDYYTVH